MTEPTDKRVICDATATAMVEADGYKNVKSLVQAPDGAWRGLAMRGAVEMAISVDANGRVLAEQPGVTADGGGGVEARE